MLDTYSSFAGLFRRPLTPHATGFDMPLCCAIMASGLMAVTKKSKLSRQEQRNLDIEISFLEGVTRRDPEYVDALQILGDDYTRRGKFEQGLMVDLRLAQLRPSDPLVHYNLGCSLALTDRPDAAFESLNRALDAGYRDFRWMSKDPDLALFRKHPLYRKLRARIRTLQVPTR